MPPDAGPPPARTPHRTVRTARPAKDNPFRPRSIAGGAGAAPRFERGGNVLAERPEPRLADAEDQDVVDAIVQGDPIEPISIDGDTEALFAEQADRIAEWNARLAR